MSDETHVEVEDDGEEREDPLATPRGKDASAGDASADGAAKWKTRKNSGEDTARFTKRIKHKSEKKGKGRRKKKVGPAKDVKRAGAGGE